MSTICRVIGQEEQEVTPQPHLPYTRVPPVLFGLVEMGYHLGAYSERVCHLIKFGLTGGVGIL
jgi:hypothetical protein